MSKKRNQNFTISDFYCIECGKRGVSIPRKEGQQREAGHLKKLWCPYCQKETNHAEIRPFGAYNKEDFDKEFKLGRFANGQRIALADLIGCSKLDCDYNVDGKCWNANYSFECNHRKEKEII